MCVCVSVCVLYNAAELLISWVDLLLRPEKSLLLGEASNSLWERLTVLPCAGIPICHVSFNASNILYLCLNVLARFLLNALSVCFLW